MLVITHREPRCDVDAQIAALCNPLHPKRAVFLSASNQIPVVDVPGVFRADRSEGVLFTTDPDKLAAFSRPGLTDDDMAEILGYPETKSAIAASGQCLVVQVRDENGSVITEAAASLAGAGGAIDALSAHIPSGGSIALVSLSDALLRRAFLCGIENGNQ